MILCIKIPARGRLEQTKCYLSKHIELLSGKHKIKFIVNIDKDDTILNTEDFINFCKDNKIKLYIDPPSNKITAYNAHVPTTKWDILICSSNDMLPIVKDYDDIIVKYFEQYIPNLDGILHINDGYKKDIICTLPIMGRKAYDLFGYVYYPEYKGFYCDDEQTEVFKRLKLYNYIDTCLIKHEHPANTKSIIMHDEIYNKNQITYEEDRLLYLKRKSNNFGLSLPPKLSILICTIMGREKSLYALLDKINMQITEDVEFLIDSSEPPITTGEKRNNLLEKANGDYIAFVDDDDLIDSKYVSLILNAIKKGPDCVGICGIAIINGNINTARKFIHTINCTKWYTDEHGTFYRNILHLNPVKRELALKARFPNQNISEDYVYGERLKPLLKTEVKIEVPIYLYNRNTEREIKRENIVKEMKDHGTFLYEIK